MSDDQNQLIALHTITARLHTLVDDVGLPMLRELLDRADKIEQSQQTASAKLDAFIEHEFKPAKIQLAKIPGLTEKVVLLENDINELRDEFAASREEDLQSIATLRQAESDRARTAQRDHDMRAGEMRITKKILWLASTSAGVLGMIISKYGDQLLKLLKGIL